MHSYSVDVSRQRYGVYLFSVAVMASVGLNTVLGILTSLYTIPVPAYLMGVYAGFGLTSVTAFFIYHGLNQFFKERAWAWQLIAGYHGIPELSGKWTGHINVDGEDGKDPVSVWIKQTWDEIEVRLELDNGQAVSHSISGSMETNGVFPRLVITYQSKQKGPGAQDRDSHEGVNWLEYIQEENVIEGWYVTEPSRGSHGTIRLERTGD